METMERRCCRDLGNQWKTRIASNTALQLKYLELVKTNYCLLRCTTYAMWYPQRKSPSSQLMTCEEKVAKKSKKQLNQFSKLIPLARSRATTHRNLSCRFTRVEIGFSINGTPPHAMVSSTSNIDLCGVDILCQLIHPNTHQYVF